LRIAETSDHSTSCIVELKIRRIAPQTLALESMKQAAKNGRLTGSLSIKPVALVTFPAAKIILIFTIRDAAGLNDKQAEARNQGVVAIACSTAVLRVIGCAALDRGNADS